MVHFAAKPLSMIYLDQWRLRRRNHRFALDSRSVRQRLEHVVLEILNDLQRGFNAYFCHFYLIFKLVFLDSTIRQDLASV